MYVAVKGGQKAIEAAHQLLAETGRGDPALPELTVEQIQNQLRLAVDRAQAEGALYAPKMAALAVKQAQGDLVEAIFLVRAARASLKRFGYSEPVEPEKLLAKRRVSGAFKDLPGGQILGPTFDYSHRLLRNSSGQSNCLEKNLKSPRPNQPKTSTPSSLLPELLADFSPDFSLDSSLSASLKDQNEVPKEETLTTATYYLEKEGLLEKQLADLEKTPFDLTREPLEVPLDRSGRLQALARADEGFLLSLAYSSQRGYGSVHPFVVDLRLGAVEVEFLAPELGEVITIGQIELTECQTANQFKGGGGQPPMFTRGYGLTFGHNERKALSMAIVDRALRAKELGESIKGPAQDEEFVLYHGDNVEASGFVSHIKLPHYVDFQAELGMLRAMRKNYQSENSPPADDIANNAKGR